MYLSPSGYNKRDSEVAEVQRMLNIIRTNFHHNWGYLSEDGIYGRETANAVRQFQIYKGISSQMTADGPILGDTTIQYIREAYNYVPQITAPSPSFQPYHAPKKANPIDIIEFITDKVISCIQTFDDFLHREITYVSSLRNSNPNALQQRFYSFATKMDPTMKKLKKHLSACHNGDEVLKHAFHNKNAKANRKNLVKDLKKFDIIAKIEHFLESKGITGNIKGGVEKPKTIKVKGSGILALWTYKDLIIDVCKVTEWGTEKWNADVKKHFFELLDGLIIGYASTVIAELIVGATVAAVGVTISAGWVVAIIAIAALLISLLFSYLMSEADVSFSQKAFEGYSEIISLVKF